MTKQIIHDKDLSFTIAYRHNVEVAVDFWIYDIVGENEDGTPVWNVDKTEEGFDPVWELDKAQVFAHGAVKWDGCSDWLFDQQEQGYLHGCTRQQLAKLTPEERETLGHPFPTSHP